MLEPFARKCVSLSTVNTAVNYSTANYPSQCLAGEARYSNNHQWGKGPQGKTGHTREKTQ